MASPQSDREKFEASGCDSACLERKSKRAKTVAHLNRIIQAPIASDKIMDKRAAGFKRHMNNTKKY